MYLLILGEILYISPDVIQVFHRYLHIVTDQEIDQT